LEFVEQRWNDLPTWFDGLKDKDKLVFLIELLPFCLRKLKQVDATLTSEGPQVRRVFPFGGYTNSRGEFVQVDDDAFFYSNG